MAESPDPPDCSMLGTGGIGSESKPGPGLVPDHGHRPRRYVSFRPDGGAWGEPQLLPPTINSELLDYCPMGTPDGRYLFFSRRTGQSWEEADAGDVYWVDAAVIERMRP